MVGFYRSVAKPRVYLLLSVGLAVREESRRRRWQIQSRFARTKQSRNERERVSRHGFNFHALRAPHTALLKLRSAADCCPLVEKYRCVSTSRSFAEQPGAHSCARACQ